MRAAAEHVSPVLLELGGQNPAIVDEAANIPDAAKKIVWGAMAWRGQWCASPGYAVVHESVAEQLAECKMAVVARYGAKSVSIFPPDVAIDRLYTPLPKKEREHSISGSSGSTTSIEERTPKEGPGWAHNEEQCRRQPGTSRARSLSTPS